MIEELFKLVQQESHTDIINNPAIPNEQNNQAVGLATESIFGGLQGALANGGLRDVLGMFGDKANVDPSHPVVSGITDNFVGGLMKKLGLDSGAATGIAASLIPGILGKLVNKTNDPNDSSFNINNIIGALTGGGASNSNILQPSADGSANSGGGIDFGSIVKNLTSGGLDANHDGKVSLDDLSGMLGGAASAQQQNSAGGGGITDMLKGLLGN